MKVFRNARVYAYDPGGKVFSGHDALVLDGPTIAGCDARDCGANVEAVDLGGATVLAAFADCHVHVTDTGYFLDDRNLSGTRSYEDFAAAVERLQGERIVFAGQYDESAWLDGKSADARPLERAHANSLAMLVRVDGHSCVVNRKTLSWLELPADTEGIERGADGTPTGKLFLNANWRAQAAFMKKIPRETKRAAERRAAGLALSRGALHLHAQLVGFERDEYAAEIAALAQIHGVKWYPKICEPDPRLARELGLRYIGGDVFLDGSIGSCTAAVSEPFLAASEGAERGSGALNYTDEQLYEYFESAERLGISAGVHAIGDRAIEQCISTWERVLDGAQSARGNRHFIEHFEIAEQRHIERCAELGLHLSMQPQFDLLWGGAGRMYDERLGTPRMRSMNALGRAQRAGAVLCGGDDSPVCELDPLAGMQSAVDHHEPEERLTPAQALAMYTYNAALLGHAETSTGNLAPGLAADFVVLDGDPLEGTPFTECTVLATWSDGECVYAR